MNTKLLLKLFLIACLGLIYNVTKSNQTGIFNNGTNCSTCHGNVSSNTTVALTGLPATYVKGTTYPLSVTVTNTTNTKAGFNLAVSSGTLTAGTGSKVNANGSQITHTAPKTAVANVTTFSFSWTAPTTGTSAVTFNTAGNSVNGNSSDGAGDFWNSVSNTISQAPSGIISNDETSKIKCFPNPTTKFVTIEGENITNISIFNLLGQEMNAEFTSGNDFCTVNCENLPVGTYILKATINGNTVVSSFIKN